MVITKNCKFSTSNSFDLGRQAALVTSSFVLVDQAFGRHTIHDRLSNSESGSRSSFVARGDSSNDFLQVGTGHGTTAGVVLTAFF